MEWDLAGQQARIVALIEPPCDSSTVVEPVVVVEAGVAVVAVEVIVVAAAV